MKTTALTKATNASHPEVSHALRNTLRIGLLHRTNGNEPSYCILTERAWTAYPRAAVRA
jgi:hypothetical protein